MGEIPPSERCADQRPSQEIWANLLQYPGMPELKYFHETGAYEYPERDLGHQRFPGPQQETNEDPKNLVKEPCSIIVEPPLNWARIQLEQKPCWGHNQEDKEDVFSNERLS